MSVILNDLPQLQPSSEYVSGPVSVSPKSYQHIFQLSPASPSFNGQSHTIAYSHVHVESVTCRIPTIVVQCFDKIFENSSVEGIFRINGSVKRIGIVYNHLLNNEDFDSITEYYNCHDVCGVLKKFLKVYLPLINDIFSPNHLFFDKFKVFYDEYVNHDRNSMNSFKTALTTLDNQSLIDLINNFTKYILVKNSSFKNNLLLYFLFNINKLCQSESTTKMTSLNYSIIFQPYLFNSSNLSYLPFLQDFLHVLIDNFDLLLETYQSNYLQIENDDLNSINSVESINISPITNNSQYDSILEKNTALNGKRNSVTSKFSNFLENYYTPTNRKRFSINFSQDKKEEKSNDIHENHLNLNKNYTHSRTSIVSSRDNSIIENPLTAHSSIVKSSELLLMSRKSSYAKSKENLALKNSRLEVENPLTTHSSLVKSSELLLMSRNSSIAKSRENLVLKSSKLDADNSINSSIKRSDDSLMDMNSKFNVSTPATTKTNLEIDQPIAIKSKKSKRKSFLGLFKNSNNNSSNSISSKKLNSVNSTATTTTSNSPYPNMKSHKSKSPYSNLNNSIDDILITKKHDSLLHPEQKSLLNRNFSLRIKPKKF